MTAPWPIDGPDVLSQVRFIVWELEGARHGHRVVDHPRDPGGRTLSGLTWRTYSADVLLLPPGKLCPQAQFDALTLDDVVDALTTAFAMRPNLWAIADPALRLAVLDFAIHAGPGDAITALQQALGVVADGICGRQTIAALDRHPAPAALRLAVMDARYQKAARRVVARPDQLAFLAGWTVRFGRILRRAA